MRWPSMGIGSLQVQLGDYRRQTEGKSGRKTSTRTHRGWRWDRGKWRVQNEGYSSYDNWLAGTA